MGEYAVVAVGYNRLSSMKRLLSHLRDAYYGDDSVDLIISIDKSNSTDVEMLAEEFEWKYGRKSVRTFEENQGLRKHIISCGKLVEDYRAIAVFEDDIVPAKGFYMYMREAVPFFEQDERIAGISLYTHLWNVNVDCPFQPSYSPYDIYFQQFAQSWGQIWTKKQWHDFYKWYQKNDQHFDVADGVPDNVSKWPDSSWLKYHIRYCVENNKTFVYPYISLCTCFSEKGTHSLKNSNVYQVPFLEGIRSDYRFASLDDTGSVKYDAFFERIFDDDFTINGISISEICIDLYGSKKNYENKAFLLSCKNINCKIVRSYGLELRPIENNIIYKAEGNDFFLFDISKTDKLKVGNNYKFRNAEYRYRLYCSMKTLIGVSFRKLCLVVKEILFKRV